MVRIAPLFIAKRRFPIAQASQRYDAGPVTAEIWRVSVQKSGKLANFGLPEGTMKLDLERWAVAGTFALVCIVGPGMAQAANIVASETGDTATLAGSEFDITPFTSISDGE